MTAVPLDGDRLDALERLAEAQAAHKAARYAGLIEVFDKADEALEDAIGTFVARVDLTALAAEVRASRAEVERLTGDVKYLLGTQARLSKNRDARIRERDEARAALAAAERTLAEVETLIGYCEGHRHIAAEAKSCPWCRVRTALTASRTGAADKENDRASFEHDWDVMQSATTCRRCGSEYDNARRVNCPGAAEGESDRG